MQPILKIHLDTGKTDVISIPPSWEREYLGGSSLAARILYDSLSRDLDPLSPDAPLLFLTGPLTGTSGPSVGRFVVCGKSPATGLWAEANAGGFWGVELRKTGYDGVWITGKASAPVYLWVHEGKAELRDASALWGQDTYEIQESIRRALNLRGVRVAGIGPAGESRLPFAGIFCDHGRTAGRAGLGAVMGAKNLKAIALRGTRKIPLADEASYRTLRTQANLSLKSDPLTALLRDLGTAGGADYFDYLGEMPKKYFGAGVLDGSEKISGASVAESILVGKTACHACVISCGRVVDLGDGVKRKGPEYETLVGFGPNLGLTDPKLATRLGERCDRYGMDVISASGTIGLAFALYEKGILTDEETDGLALTWGNAEAAEILLEKLIRREGIGAFLAEGARAFARRFGAEEEAAQVNGLEAAYHDPRGASGMALVYATSPRGACHNKSDYFFVDIGQAEDSLGMTFFDRHAGAEKAANVARHQNWRTVYDALVMCHFANVPPETVRDLVNAATGMNLSVEDLLTIGARGFTLKRLINRRLGLTRENDALPARLLRPLEDGGAAGYLIPFEEMLAAYYDARGWDAETGFPSEETRRALNIPE